MYPPKMFPFELMVSCGRYKMLTACSLLFCTLLPLACVTYLGAQILGSQEEVPKKRAVVCFLSVLCHHLCRLHQRCRFPAGAAAFLPAA